MRYAIQPQEGQARTLKSVPADLAALMAQRMWRYEDFCREFDRTARELGVSATVSVPQVSRWIRGESVPGRLAQHVLQTMICTRSPDSETRQSISKTGTWKGAAERSVTMAAHESAERASVLSEYLDAETVDSLREQVVLLARTYADAEPLAFHQQAWLVRQLLQRLTERTRRPTQLSDLYLLTGQVCALMAAATFDVGHYAAATQQVRAAYTLAEVVDHPGLRTYSRGLQAVIAFWDGRPQQAVELSKSAQQFAVGGTMSVRLACVQARSWAYVGATEEVHAAIARAREARQTNNYDDDMCDTVAGEFGFSPARELNWYGTALVTVHDPVSSLQCNAEALTLLQRAELSDQSHHEPGLASYIETDMANAHLQLGEVDAASAALGEVWQITEAKRRSALTGRLATTSTLLRNPQWRGNRVAAELRDQIENYRAQAQATRSLPQ